MATQPWERQPGETTRAWEAFKLYRDMAPAERSMDGAYHLTLTEPQKAAKSRHKAPGAWKDWAIDHDWKQRAAAYDRDQERRRRQERDRVHDAEMKRFRAQLQKDAQAAADVARIALTKGAQGLKDLDMKGAKPGAVASLLRAAAALTGVANETLFVGLGLDELMTTLEDTPVSDSEPEAEPEEE